MCAPLIPVHVPSSISLPTSLKSDPGSSIILQTNECSHYIVCVETTRTALLLVSFTGTLIAFDYPKTDLNCWAGSSGLITICLRTFNGCAVS